MYLAYTNLGFQLFWMRSPLSLSLLWPVVFGARSAVMSTWLMDLKTGLNSKVKILYVNFLCCGWLLRIEIQQIYFCFLNDGHFYSSGVYCWGLITRLIYFSSQSFLSSSVVTVFFNVLPSTDSIPCLPLCHKSIMKFVILPYKPTTVCVCMWLS